MRIPGVSPTMLLDVRVPTTTPLYSEEKRQEILSKIQPGDVFLETNNAYPNWQRLEQIAFRSSFTHAAIFEGWQDGKPMLLEATTGDPSGAGVIRSNLNEVLEGPIQVAVVRPNYQTPEDKEAALDFCRSQLGKPYDGGFNYADNSAFYCSELVDKALKSMPHPIETQTCRAVGVGREAIAPDAFLKLPNTEQFGDKPNFVGNMMSHWPVALSAAAGAAVGAASGSAIGGVAGFAVGLLGSICAGNKIQTGHFNLSGV